MLFRSGGFALWHPLEIILQVLERLLERREAVVAVKLRFTLMGDLLQREDFRRVAPIGLMEEDLVEAVGNGLHLPVLLFQHANGFDDAVNDRLGPRGAAGDIDIHWNDAIDAAADVVALAEDAAAGGADADGHHHFGLGQLMVDFAYDRLALLIDRAGHQEDVRVLWVAGVEHPQAFDIEYRREASQHLDIAAVAARGVVVDEPGRLFDTVHGGPGLLYRWRSQESTRMFPKPSTAATSQALCKAVCHLSRAKTLSTRITNPNTSSETVTPSTGEEAKKRYTQPSTITFSDQCAISMSASARPETSVVMPRTNSWWA